MVCGSKNDVHTEDLDIIMNEYDDSSKPFAMKIIAESIMHYRNNDILRGKNVTDDDVLLDYMLKQWDGFSMLEYVRTVLHYSQDTMSEKLCLPRKKYRKYEKEQEYPDAEALAVGVSLAFLKVNIIPAVSFIGCITFVCSAAGVKIGSIFGDKYRSKAGLCGGIILILIGVKILLDGMGII